MDENEEDYQPTNMVVDEDQDNDNQVIQEDLDDINNDDMSDEDVDPEVDEYPDNDDLLADEDPDNELNDKFYDACEQKNFQEVKRLHALGANVNCRKSDDNDGKTPLMVAAVEGTCEIVKYLLDNGADPSLLTWASSTDALNFACRSSNIDTIKLLMKPREEGGGGLDINRAAGGNWLPIHSAANWGQTEVLKFLISLGVPPDPQTVLGRTPLGLAAECSKIACMKVLLDAGANPNIPDPYGQTPLFAASRVASLDSMKLLVEVGKAEVNYVDKFGNTAFSEADKMNMWELALYLWKQGASVKGLKRTTGPMSSLHWSRPISLNAPSPRYSAASFYTESRAWILGGYGLPTDTINPDPESNHGPTGAHLDDVYYCDLDKPETMFLGKKLGDKQDSIDESQLNGLNPSRAAKYLVLEGDGLTVFSTDELDPDVLGVDDDDCGSIQALKPFTPDHPLPYFEIQVIDHGARNIVTFGLTEKDFELSALPGWKKRTVGYHGDDGQLFHNRGRGTPWGPRYGTGDTVGCGVNYKTREVFFTKNGEFLGIAAKGIDVNEWFPTIGFRSPNARVKINFGLEPFKFSFSAPVLRWNKADKIQFIDSRVPPLPLIVVDYIPKHKIIVSTEIETSSRVQIFDYENMIMTSKPVTLRGPAPYSAGLMLSFKAGNFVYSVFRRKKTKHTTKSEITVYRMDVTEELWTVERIIPPLAKEAPEPTEGQSHVSHEAIEDPFETAAYLIGDFANEIEEAAYTKDNHIVFIGQQTWMLHFNPATGEARKVEASGKFPNSKKYSATPVNDQIVTFGGWNEREQQFDVHVYDKDRALWFKPHVSGTVPRPRNNHMVITAENQRKIFFAGGWNGRSFLDDVDVLAMQTLVPEEFGIFLNSADLYDITLNVQGQMVKCQKAILYCRSKYFKNILDRDPSVTEISISDVKFPLFYALLNYLYTDLIDTTQVTEELVHEFINLCEKYTAEHVPRITEELLLTRVQQSSTMSDDFSQIINQKLFSDVEFVIEGQTYYGHKAIICARSEYFRALCLGNLRESKQRVIELSDVSSSAWRAVVQWLYCKRPDWNAITAHASEIYVAAGHYAALGLKTTVETALLAQVQDELANEYLTIDELSAALAVYELADSCNATEFARSCAQLISDAQPTIAAQQILYTMPDEDRMLYAKAISSLN